MADFHCLSSQPQRQYRPNRDVENILTPQLPDYPASTQSQYQQCLPRQNSDSDYSNQEQHLAALISTTQPTNTLVKKSVTFVKGKEVEDSGSDDNSAAVKAKKAREMSGDGPLPFLKIGPGNMKSDKMFGWRPSAGKLDIPPIPLCFGLVEYNIDDLIKPEKILYLGQRYQNSYKMHDNFANKNMQMPWIKRNQFTGQIERHIYSFDTYQFKLPKIAKLDDIKYEDAFQSFSEQMENTNDSWNFMKRQLRENQTIKQTMIQNTLALRFDSDFESGNLDLAARTFNDRNDEYDLIMRLDSNSRTHQQWFYFAVDAKDKGSYKNQKVRLNILNFTKPFSLYQQGMQPLVWSQKLYEEQGIGWQRGGAEINYSRGRLKRMYYSQPCPCLSFEYQFLYDNDKVYFAYGVPFTFSMLNSFIGCCLKVQQEQENQDKSFIFKSENVGQSLSGIPIPLLTITDFQSKAAKKTIVINGRIHPGETSASWVLHGLIRFLLSKAPAARALRKRAIFKIFPIMNIDGVIAGNYRTSFSGADLNRMFGDKVNKRLNPEATMLKDFTKKEKKIAFYFDIHGHSSKKSVFMYGPRFPLHSEHYLKIRILPKLIAKKTQYFRYYSCRFANEPYKRNCSRLALSRELNLPNCYTFEVSMMGYLSKERLTEDLGIKEMTEMGEKMAQSLLDWFVLVEKHKIERIRRAVEMQHKGNKKKSLLELIGNEDYEEYRDEIEAEIVKKQQRVALQANAAKPTLSKRRTASRKQREILPIKQGETMLNLKITTGEEDFQNFGQPSGPPKLSKNGAQSARSAFQPEPTVGNGHSDNNLEEESDQSDSGEVQRPQTQMAPTLEQQQLGGQRDYYLGSTARFQLDDQSNLGFDLPLMCGFEWLDPPMPKQKPPQDISDIHKQSTRHLTLATQPSRKGDLLHSDDPLLQSVGDEVRSSTLIKTSSKLNRLEDIYHEIKQDLAKAQKLHQRKVAKPTSSKAGFLSRKNQSMRADQNDNEVNNIEEDLDSQKGNSSQESNNEVPNDTEREELKIQDCLISFFQHIEKNDQDQHDRTRTFPQADVTPQTNKRPATGVNRNDQGLKADGSSQSALDSRQPTASQVQTSSSIFKDQDSTPAQQRRLTHPPYRNNDSLNLQQQSLSTGFKGSSSFGRRQWEQLQKQETQNTESTSQATRTGLKQSSPSKSIRPSQPFVQKIAVRRVQKLSYPTSIIKSNPLPQGQAQPMPPPIGSNPAYKLVPPDCQQQQSASVENNRIIVHNPIIHQPQPQPQQKKIVAQTKQQQPQAELPSQQANNKAVFSNQNKDFISRLKKEFHQQSKSLEAQAAGTKQTPSNQQQVTVHHCSSQHACFCSQQQQQTKYQHVNTQLASKLMQQQHAGKYPTDLQHSQVGNESQTKLWYQQQLTQQMVKFAAQKQHSHQQNLFQKSPGQKQTRYSPLQHYSQSLYYEQSNNQLSSDLVRHSIPSQQPYKSQNQPQQAQASNPSSLEQQPTKGRSNLLKQGGIIRYQSASKQIVSTSTFGGQHVTRPDQQFQAIGIQSNRVNSSTTSHKAQHQAHRQLNSTQNNNTKTLQATIGEGQYQQQQPTLIQSNVVKQQSYSQPRPSTVAAPDAPFQQSARKQNQIQVGDYINGSNQPPQSASIPVQKLPTNSKRTTLAELQRSNSNGTLLQSTTRDNDVYQ